MNNVFDKMKIRVICVAGVIRSFFLCKSNYDTPTKHGSMDRMSADSLF